MVISLFRFSCESRNKRESKESKRKIMKGRGKEAREREERMHGAKENEGMLGKDMEEQIEDGRQ